MSPVIIGFYGERNWMMGKHRDKYSTKLWSLLDVVIFPFLSIHIHIQKLVRLLSFPPLHMAISFLSRILVLFPSCLRDSDFGEC